MTSAMESLQYGPGPLNSSQVSAHPIALHQWWRHGPYCYVHEASPPSSHPALAVVSAFPTTTQCFFWTTPFALNIYLFRSLAIPQSKNTRPVCMCGVPRSTWRKDLKDRRIWCSPSSWTMFQLLNFINPYSPAYVAPNINWIGYAHLAPTLHCQNYVSF